MQERHRCKIYYSFLEFLHNNFAFIFPLIFSILVLLYNYKLLYSPFYVKLSMFVDPSVIFKFLLNILLICELHQSNLLGFSILFCYNPCRYPFPAGAAFQNSWAVL